MVQHRLNYGTVFQELPPLYSSSEYWSHTFIINILPQLTNDLSSHNCNCHYQDIIRRFSKLHNDTYNEIHQTTDLIFQFLKTSHTHKTPSRNRRSLLPFIGTIGKSLFGLATSNDVQHIANHVNALQKQNILLNKKFTHQTSILTSFMSTTNDRLDNAFKGIEANRKP